MDNPTFVFFGVSLLALIVAFVALLVGHIHHKSMVNTFNEMQMDINETTRQIINELVEEVKKLKQTK
jgi:hypothetical protein